MTLAPPSRPSPAFPLSDLELANGRDIAAPQKRPHRTNVFDLGRSAGSALTPLFPYLGDGDIVPAVSVYRGGVVGHVFEHLNTVEEIYFCFGAAGTPLRVGQVRVGERKHPVGTFLPQDRDAYALVVVTHRQSETGVPQQEAWTVYCEKCSTVLVDYHFDAKPNYRAKVPIPAGYAEPIQTPIGSVTGMAELNKSIDSRTCKKCGHVREIFRGDAWHWDIYEEHSWCVDRSLIAYEGAAKPR